MDPLPLIWLASSEYIIKFNPPILMLLALFRFSFKSRVFSKRTFYKILKRMPCAIWGYLEESQQKVILNIKFSLSRKWGAKCWEKDPSEDLRYYYCAKFHSSRSQTRRALIQVWMKYIQVAMLSRDFTAWNISLLLDAVVSSVHFCAYYAHSVKSV